jgi:hypothetical protein
MMVLLHWKLPCQATAEPRCARRTQAVCCRSRLLPRQQQQLPLLQQQLQENQLLLPAQALWVWMQADPLVPTTGLYLQLQSQQLLTQQQQQQQQAHRTPRATQMLVTAA